MERNKRHIFLSASGAKSLARTGFILLLILNVYVCSGQSIRECIVSTCEKYSYVREATGKNDGPEVKYFLSTCGLGEGFFWCGAYAGAVFIENCIIPPKGHCWSPSWNPKHNRTEYPAPGDSFTIYSYTKKREIHIGLVIRIDGEDVYTSEGNSNDNGSNNGDRVTFNKHRKKKVIHSFNNWID